MIYSPMASLVAAEELDVAHAVLLDVERRGEVDESSLDRGQRAAALHASPDRAAVQPRDVALEREKESGPKDASWPMHCCGNTAVKG